MPDIEAVSEIPAVIALLRQPFILSALLFTAGSNGHVTYGGVTEDGFIINPVTGVITTTKELDTELQSHYTLTGTVKK